MTRPLGIVNCDRAENALQLVLDYLHHLEESSDLLPMDKIQAAKLKTHELRKLIKEIDDS